MLIESRKESTHKSIVIKDYLLRAKKCKQFQIKIKRKPCFCLGICHSFSHDRKKCIRLLGTEETTAMIWPGFIELIGLTSLALCALLTAHPVVLSHCCLSYIKVTGFGSGILFAWAGYTRPYPQSREITSITTNQLRLILLLVKMREN